MHQQRDSGTKLPMMYRRQPEYVDNGKQYFSDPDDDADCRTPEVPGKSKKTGNKSPKRNKMGIVLGINLLLLGLVVYLMQTYLISNNGLLMRDGMRYELRARENEGFLLVSVIVAQEEETSPLSGQPLTVEISLVIHSKDKNQSSGASAAPPSTVLTETMPNRAGDIRVMQAFLDLPAGWDPAALKNYTVRAHFSAGKSNLVVNTPVTPKTSGAVTK